MADLSDIQLRIIVQGTGLENIQRTNDTLGKMIGAIGQSASAADSAKGAWSQFGTALSQLERDFDAVFRAASHLQALGRDLTGMGEAGLGFLNQSLEAWGDYEFAVHRAAGALGIFDTTAPIFHRLQSAIDETAQEARLFPAEEIAKAVYYWGSATGQTVTNHEELAIVMEGLLPIMQVSAITEADYQQAIKGTYQIIQQYRLGLTRLADAQDVAAGRASHVGQELSNTADITEKLMMITQNTALEYSDLIEAFKYTGSIAPALGVGWEEIAITLGRLGDLGIRGSMAGRALQQTFTKLVDPTVRASNALDEAWQKAYGLDKTFAGMVFPNGEFIGLTEYIDQLADVTEEMTQQERNNLIAIMTTQNELRTMVPLVEDQIRARREGISVYESEKFALEDASAQFEKTMHLLEISWQGTMGYLTNTIGPVMRAIGSEVANLARPFVEQIGKIMVQIRKWMDTHPEIVQWGVKIIAVASVIAILAGAMFTAIGVLLAFGAGIAFVVKGFGHFFRIFNKFLPILGAVTTAITLGAAIWVNNFGGLRDAIIRVGEAFGKILEKLDFSGNDSMGILQNLATVILPPLEIVARGVALGLEGLAWALERIAESDHAIAVVQGLVTALMLLVTISFASKIAGIALSIATLGAEGRGSLQAIRWLQQSLAGLASFSTLKNPKKAFGDLKAAIELTAEAAKKSNIAKIIGSIASTTVNTAGTVASNMAQMLSSIRITAAGISLAIRGVLIATGIGAIIVAITLLAQAWMENWGDIQGKTKAVIDWVRARIDSFVGWVTSTWNTVTTTIRNAWNNTINFFRDLPGRIGTFLSELWNNVTTWIGSIVATIVAFPGIVWQGIVDGFNNIMTFLGQWWESLGTQTSERVGFIVAFVLLLPVRILMELVTKFAEIFMFLSEWWDGLMKSTSEWVISVFNTVVEWISKLPGQFADWFGQVLRDVGQWWTNLNRDVNKWVSDVVTSIVDWISKVPGHFADWFGRTWNDVAAWFGRFISDVGTWASNAVNSIIAWIKQLPGSIIKFFGDTGTAVFTWFTVDFIPNIGQWTRNAVNAVIDFFRELPGRIIRVIDNVVPMLINFFEALPGNIWDAITSVGGNIVKGIWQGMIDFKDWIIRQITGFIRGIVRGAAAVLGIDSPSKVFEYMGNMMVEGLAVGVHRNDHAVIALNEQVNEMVHAADRLRYETLDLSTDFTLSTEIERRLIVDHRVSSPDGTVNASTQEQLKDIFTADEFVSALEHMVTVG